MDLDLLWRKAWADALLAPDLVLATTKGYDMLTSHPFRCFDASLDTSLSTFGGISSLLSSSSKPCLETRNTFLVSQASGR